MLSSSLFVLLMVFCNSSDQRGAETHVAGPAHRRFFHVLFFSLLLLLIFMEVDALPLHRIVQLSSPILFMSNLVCNWREDLTK